LAKVTTDHRPQKPRPRHHRYFLDWYALNRKRFACELQLIDLPGEWVRFSFTGINRAIEGSLTRAGISVSVDYQDYCWDLIFDEDCSAVQVAGGFVCRLAVPGTHIVFKDRRAMWTDHQFEPFLDWVNERVAPANWLVLEGDVPGWSAARLTVEAPTAEDRYNMGAGAIRIVVPLRQDPTVP
jgi:hypothetical protein